MRRIAFIGHRDIYNELAISRELVKAIIKEIKKDCVTVIIGCHGNFDKLALNVCLGLKFDNIPIRIEIAVTSFEKARKYNELAGKYLNTFMYDIEETHYKRKILKSNFSMINDCDTLICYVDKDMPSSGAKKVLDYAIKKGLKIINLYDIV